MNEKTEQEIKLTEKQVTPEQTILLVEGGWINIENGTEFANAIIEYILEKDCINMIVDLSQIQGIDSFGIGSLLICNKRMKEKKGVIEFIMNQNIRDIFLRANLHKIMKIKLAEEVK